MDLAKVKDSEWFPQDAECVGACMAWLGAALGNLSLSMEAGDPAKAWEHFRKAEAHFAALSELLPRCMEAAETWRKAATVKGYKASKEWKSAYFKDWYRRHPERAKRKRAYDREYYMKNKVLKLKHKEAE